MPILRDTEALLSLEDGVDEGGRGSLWAEGGQIFLKGMQLEQ